VTDAITQSEYDAAVEPFVEMVVDEAEEMVESGHFDSRRQGVMEMCSEELNYHDWFARNYYDGALYGSIVEHADTDPASYSDWPALIESDTPEGTLKRLAFVVMEADVMSVALDRVEADADAERA
jgi:hypothetical protein